MGGLLGGRVEGRGTAGQSGAESGARHQDGRSAADDVDGLGVDRLGGPRDLVVPGDVGALVEDDEPAFGLAEGVEVAGELAQAVGDGLVAPADS